MLMLVALNGCVDEKIVYRDGPNFAAPPAAAASFLGYSDEANKVTVCGNCHVGQQAKWKETKHASAFATLATPESCSSRRACTSSAVREMDWRSLVPERASTAIGRSPGSLVRRVGRSARSGSWARASRWSGSAGGPRPAGRRGRGPWPDWRPGPADGASGRSCR